MNSLSGAGVNPYIQGLSARVQSNKKKVRPGRSADVGNRCVSEAPLFAWSIGIN